METQDTAPCLEIRRIVFIDEQEVPEALETEGEGPHCLHYLTFLGNQPIGTLRITPKPDYAKVERVAILKEARGTGAGAALMRYVLSDLAKKGYSEARLGSQISAQGFYEKLGFEPFGEIFVDADIDHIMMKRAL